MLELFPSRSLGKPEGCETTNPAQKTFGAKRVTQFAVLAKRSHEWLPPAILTPCRIGFKAGFSGGEWYGRASRRTRTFPIIAVIPASSQAALGLSPARNDSLPYPLHKDSPVGLPQAEESSGRTT